MENSEEFARKTFDNRVFVLQALLPGISLKSPVIGRELTKMTIYYSVSSSKQCLGGFLI